MTNTQALMAKIHTLPPERLGEVEDFVDFIASWGKRMSLTRAAEAPSEASFAAFCDSLEDDAYDEL